MQGLGLSSLKKHPYLIPIYLAAGLGLGAAIFSITRAALRNPDVSWNTKTNPEPWQEYSNKQYKLYSPIRDYSKTESPAPKYTED
ncbi:cytochrome c oxidase subunit NDUFA4 [Sergentomyia squamirostris]